jgi:cardiolipin synthase
MNAEGEDLSATRRHKHSGANEQRRSEILTLPNILSFMRILLTPVFIWATVQRRPWLAFGVFLLAGATDALDGFTARHFGLKTNLGLWLDPLGDKVLLTAAFIVLTFPRWSTPNTLPLWLTLICVGRDVLIALGALIFIWIRGRTHFKPSLLGKASTVLGVVVLLLVLVLNGLGKPLDSLGILYVLTAALAGLSGVHYIVTGIGRFFGTRKRSGA